MKKITFLIAALIGLAIVSCSTHDETLSTNVGIQKTIQRNDLLGYYDACIEFYDLLDYDANLETLEALGFEFNSQFGWLADTTDCSPFSEDYYDLAEFLIYTLSNNLSFEDGLIYEWSNSDILSINEKISLLNLAAAVKNLKKYQNCYALCYDEHGRYCVNYVNNLVGFSPSLKSEIDDLIGTEDFGEIIVIYSDGDEYHAITKSRSLFDGVYDFISPISLVSQSECDSIKNSRINSYYEQFNSSCAINDNLLSIGLITPEQARKNRFQYQSYFWFWYNWAMEAYFRCLNKLPTETIQVEVRQF